MHWFLLRFKNSRKSTKKLMVTCHHNEYFFSSIAVKKNKQISETYHLQYSVLIMILEIKWTRQQVCHYLTQCCLIVDWDTRNKIKSNLSQNTNCQEKAFQNVVWKMLIILSRPQHVKPMLFFVLIDILKKNFSEILIGIQKQSSS